MKTPIFGMLISNNQKDSVATPTNMPLDFIIMNRNFNFNNIPFFIEQRVIEGPICKLLILLHDMWVQVPPSAPFLYKQIKMLFSIGRRNFSRLFLITSRNTLPITCPGCKALIVNSGGLTQDYWIGLDFDSY